MRNTQNRLKNWLHAHVERLGGPTKAFPELLKRLGLENGYTLYKMQRPDVPVKIPADYLPVLAEYFGDVPPGFEFWARPLPGIENGLALPVETTAPFRQATPPAALRTAIAERSGEWPKARHRAFDVADDSMVDAGILPGATVVGVDFRDVGEAVDDGMVVVIERERGGLVERRVAAVKRVTKPGAHAIEFQPRSPNKSHKPVVMFAGKKADREGFATQVLAVVYTVISKPLVQS